MLKGKQLVRARGMIQDQLDVEYFAAGFDDLLGLVANNNTNNNSCIMERTPLHVSPIPFTTPWFRNVLQDGREHKTKRLRLDENADARDTEDGCLEHWWSSSTFGSDPDHVPFLAKLYYDQYPKADECNRPKLWLNQIVEIVGVLEDTTALSSELSNVVYLSDSDEWESSPAPTALPRLHVLWFSSHHANVDDMLQLEQLLPPMEDTTCQVLADTLQISLVASSALYMSLLSMAEREAVHERNIWAPVATPQSTALGCASLNMILPSAEACALFSKRLNTVLSAILPQVQVIDISLATLNHLTTPRKANGRLMPSPLQLPKGSCVVFNVGSIQSGKLTRQQIDVLTALQELTFGHRLQYTFEGGIRIPFEADLRIIVLSTADGNKLLPCTLQVKCEPEIMELTNIEHEKLAVVRSMLAAARGNNANSSQAPHNNIGLSKEVLDRAQRDFVDRRTYAREQNAPLPLETDFHRWLTLTRLQARSRMSKSANETDWERALALDLAMAASLEEMTMQVE
jgi:hypothetical protein